MLQTLLAEGLPKQPGAGPQVGGWSRRQGQGGDGPSQSPGHRPLQPGLRVIGRGLTAEAGADPRTAGGWGARVQRASIHVITSRTRGVPSRQWPASG